MPKGWIQWLVMGRVCEWACLSGPDAIRSFIMISRLGDLDDIPLDTVN